MKIQINTRSYNDRRYGRPYIAKLDFADDPKGAPTWGQWVGQPGDEGILITDAEPGDILMQGQKDNRGRNSAPDYYVVLADGSLESKAEAFRRWTSAAATAPHNPLAGISDDALIAEMQRRNLVVAP